MNVYTGPQLRTLPQSLVWVRGLLYVGGVISILAAIGFLWTFGASAENIGQSVWSVWPGVAAIVLARGLPEGGRGRYWTIVVVAAVWVLMGLGELGRGEPRGLTSIIIPIVILVLMFRPSAKAYLRP